ncbi:MAG: DEAD/DEAH box helicase, partial [Myxococcota bacterium]|nr:DEAD/DEAH box helicase [Myxococcota bacterium]
MAPSLLRSVSDLGFERPTEIQDRAIPPVMLGKDVLAAAATGSGKTAAFALPLLHRLLSRPPGKTRVLVLAPTRELAAQIAEHATALSRHTPLRCAAVFGGVGMKPQVDALRAGVDFLVATPGRLLDHMQHDYAALRDIETLVLDEADRMLDMGFLPDVTRLLEKLPKRRQNLLFSATLPKPIVELASSILISPIQVGVARKSEPAKGITHAAFPVADDLKPDLLVCLLAQSSFDSVLAFTRTKHRANRLADMLEKRGVLCTRIHGGRSQSRRTEALSGFKSGSFRVMVATDIAARGIDVEGLALVVNVDVPHVPEDYIHRVGRTARADATGTAVTFYDREEEEDLQRIERYIGQRLPRKSLVGFDYAQKATERFEVPIGERIAEIRARKADERKRAKEKAARRVAAETGKEGRTPARQLGSQPRP